MTLRQPTVSASWVVHLRFGARQRRLRRDKPARLGFVPRIERLEDRALLASAAPWGDEVQRPLGPADALLLSDVPTMSAPDSSPSVQLIDARSISGNTGEKPQSKVWSYANQWWSVFADSGGTGVWRLDGTAWTKVLNLISGSYNADVKPSGNLVHVLLEKDTKTRFVTVEYHSGTPGSYQLWSTNASVVTVPLDENTETATLDKDSTNRLWIAFDTTYEVRVVYSDAPYGSWSAPITLASNISSDDISLVTAMHGGQIGVLWSNQTTQRFGFRTHNDGASPGQWSADEVPASQSALNVGGGMADDHLNASVTADGTLYAAVKTSYDESGYTEIGLLVRRPNGQWDALHEVDTGGTRGIVEISEALNRVLVIYRASNSAGPIVYKESQLDTIAFGPRITLLPGSGVSNPSSVKHVFENELVVIASDNGSLSGARMSFVPPTNQAPSVSAGPDRAVTIPAAASLDGTVGDDGIPSPPNLTTTWTKFSGPGTVTFAHASAVDTTATFSLAGTYVLRLTGSDGALSTSDDMTVVVSGTATNQAPSVSAGPDRTIQISASASLDGTVTDDGLPSPPSLTTTWTKFSGPGNVTFANASAVDTTATFSLIGTYGLRLTANDGQLAANDDMTVIVNGTTIMFQNGVSPTAGYTGGRDTHLRSDNANTVYGTSSSLDLDGSPFRSMLLAWDTSSVPSASTVQTVSLALTVTNATASTYEIYELKRTWTESQSTWNVAATGTSWASPGALGTAPGNADRGTTVLGTLGPAATGTATVNLNAAGVALVQSWINNPANNLGLVISGIASASDSLQTRSREYSTASGRPRLTISYTPGSPANQPPSVSAGPDRTVTMSGAASLDGSVSDDSLPAPPSLTSTWSKFIGPGEVTFGNASAVDTTATFDLAGTYVLRLTANDGQLSTSDDMTVVVSEPVNQPPSVSAGPDRSILIAAAASLDGTVSDDGLPNTPGSVTTAWSMVNGPGTATFDDPASIDTTVSFSETGVYELQLLADDGELVVGDTVMINVTDAIPVTVAFQNGVLPGASYAGMIDTRLRNSEPTTNYGNNSTLLVDASPQSSALLQWDLSAIPASSTILNATMTLNITDESVHEFEIYEVQRAWVETQATWNIASAGVPWGQAGAAGPADRGSTVLGQLSATATGNRNITFNSDGLAVLQSWIDDPSRNYGLIIQNYTTSSDSMAFRSSETTASLRPKFEITYAPPSQAEESSIASSIDGESLALSSTIFSTTSRASQPGNGELEASPGASSFVVSLRSAAAVDSPSALAIDCQSTNGRRTAVRRPSKHAAPGLLLALDANCVDQLLSHDEVISVTMHGVEDDAWYFIADGAAPGRRATSR